MENIELLNKKSDKELYQAFLDSDKEALNILIARYHKELTNFILTYVKKIDIAEDIVQDCFMYIILNQYEYDFKYSFRTYLYTLAKSRSLNYLKKVKRTSLIEEDFNVDDIVQLNSNIENDIMKKEDKQILFKALKKLPEKYQGIITLYYFKEFKYKEICKILNQSMPKTKMMINRARKKLEKILREVYNYDE